MIEQKQIPTRTQLSTIANLIEIFTYYDPTELPNILLVFIANIIGTDNGVFYEENELLAHLQNYPGDIDISINANGELIIIGNDANLYSIDVDGNLIYTTP